MTEDSKMTTQLADVIIAAIQDRQGHEIDPGVKLRSLASDLAVAVLNSFDVAPKGQLHQEWSNSYEQQGDLGVWYPKRTDAFPHRDISDANMKMDKANPVGFIRNMRVEVRLVGPWRPA